MVVQVGHFITYQFVLECLEGRYIESLSGRVKTLLELYVRVCLLPLITFLEVCSLLKWNPKNENIA